MKWYNKLAIFLCVVVFSPIILAAVLFAGAMYLFKLPKNKKEYRESEYFKDLNIPYAGYLLYSPEYRFYNSAKKRKLPMDYIIQSSNGLEYFVFENVLYLILMRMMLFGRSIMTANVSPLTRHTAACFQGLMPKSGAVA